MTREVEKLACLKCDEVSTKAAWKKNDGSCPKCNNSTQGVAESSQDNSPMNKYYMMIVKKLKQENPNLQPEAMGFDQHTGFIQIQDNYKQDWIFKPKTQELALISESSESVNKITYGVFRKGGSIGSSSPSKPISTHDDKKEAQEKAKRMRKQLTPGERGYYKMSYVVKPIKESKINEGSGPKEKQRTKYRDINGPEHKAASNAQRAKMKKDNDAKPGKKLLKKITTESQLTEGVLDDVDDDGFMAKRQLYDMAKSAVSLHKTIQDTDNLEPWIQAKITKAADYIDTVKHYLDYEGARDADDMADEVGISDIADIDTEMGADIEPLNASIEVTEDEGEITGDMVLRFAHRRRVLDDDQYYDLDGQLDQLDYIATAVADFFNPIEELGSSDVSAIVRMFVNDANDQGITLNGARAQSYGASSTVSLGEQKTNKEARKIYARMTKSLKG